MATGAAGAAAAGPNAYTYYGVNAYEAIVNAVVADILLLMRSKKTPGFDTLLKHGGMKALINVAGSVLAAYAPVGNVNPLEVEYLSGAAAAALLSSFGGGASPTYLAGEQVLISIISHMITTRTVGYGANYLNTALGNQDPVVLNPGAPTNF